MSPPDHRPQVAAVRRERMRARLLESALTLAASQGPEAVTIDAVIAAAQVSRGSFYKYFEAPATLVQALGAEVSKAMLQVLQPLVDPLDDVAERVAVGVRTTLRLVRTHPRLGAFMARAGWPAMDRTHAFFTTVGADLQRGIRQGRLARMHPEVAVNLLAGSMVGAMHTLTERAVPRDFPEQTAAAVLRALGLTPDEALALATRPLAAPVVASGSLLHRLMQD